MVKLKSLLKENNQEKASLRLILHLDKKFPTKQKGHFPRSMRNKIAKYIYQMTKDTIADRGHSLGGGLQYSEKGRKQIAMNLAMGYEMFIEKGYQSPIKKNDIKGSDIRLMAKETMRYVKIPSIKNVLKEKNFPGITDAGLGYSNKEAQRFSVDAVNKASKEIGKAQNRAVSIFTSDMKSGKYDKFDLVRSIKDGSLKDSSFSKRGVLKQLFYDVKDRFNKYGRRKKN